SAEPRTVWRVLPHPHRAAAAAAAGDRRSDVEGDVHRERRGQLAARIHHRPRVPVVQRAGQRAVHRDPRRCLALHALRRAAHASRVAQHPHRAARSLGRRRCRAPPELLLDHPADDHPGARRRHRLPGDRLAEDVRRHLHDDQGRPGRRDHQSARPRLPRGHPQHELRRLDGDPRRAVAAVLPDLLLPAERSTQGDVGMTHTAPRTSTPPASQRSTRRRNRKRIQHTLAIVALTAWSLFALAPIVWILMMSLKTPAQVVSNPPLFFFTPTLENYAAVLSGEKFLAPFVNSIIVTAGSLALTLVIGLPTAYALARLSFRGRENIGFGILSLRFAPELLIVLPLYRLVQRTGLADNYLGLILAYEIVSLPMVVWMLRSFIEDLPAELEEAAAVDGGTRWTAFRHVLFRLIAPGLAVSLMLSFIWAWNNYMIPLVLAGKNTQTVTTGLQQYIGYQSIEWGPMAAATIVS